jgi:hypothetical protein
VKGTATLHFGPVVDPEEEGNRIDRMVWMEVGEEDAIHRERVEARPNHAANRARSQIEDERFPAGSYHDAALPPLQTGHDRAGSHDGYLHAHLLSVEELTR